MKIKILHLVLIFCCLPVKIVALNYIISFTGTGASSTVDSVIVQNLTKGTKVTVPAGNVLNLSDAPNAVEQVSANDETIHVYPATLDGKSLVSFFSRQAGSTQLNVFSIDGRKVAGISVDLQAGSNTFELSLPKGVFVMQVTGNEYAYTTKMFHQISTQGSNRIVCMSTEKSASSSSQKTKSSNLGITTMTYATGEQLLYTSISGNYSTIVTDVPIESKTTNFNFVACTDADGNNYKVVTIGTQTWMAENLKTTRYNDGNAIPLVTDNTWGNLTTPDYCWYANQEAECKNTYGALYNWYTINTGKLAPTGWHVSADSEWTTLENYLVANRYNYVGSTSGDYYAKSLAANSNWTTDSYIGAIGNDLSKNNSTGFSGLPGGCRLYDSFYTMGFDGYWWSSTKSDTYNAWYRYLDYVYSGGLRRFTYSNYVGLSVRCVKDN